MNRTSRQLMTLVYVMFYRPQFHQILMKVHVKRNRDLITLQILVTRSLLKFTMHINILKVLKSLVNTIWFFLTHHSQMVSLNIGFPIYLLVSFIHICIMNGGRICRLKICFFGILIVWDWLFLRNNKPKRSSEN